MKLKAIYLTFEIFVINVLKKSQGYKRKVNHFFFQVIDLSCYLVDV